MGEFCFSIFYCLWRLKLSNFLSYSFLSTSAPRERQIFRASGAKEIFFRLVKAKLEFPSNFTLRRLTTAEGAEKKQNCNYVMKCLGMFLSLKLLLVTVYMNHHTRHLDNTNAHKKSQNKSAPMTLPINK